jgi:hypothetical protein
MLRRHMNKKNLILLLTLFLILICEVGIADELNRELNRTKNSILTKYLPDNLTYFSQFSGPSLGNLEDPVDETGELQKGNISTWNQISFQWKISKDTKIVFNPRFLINYNTDDVDTLEYVSPVIGIATTWYKKGKLKFTGGLNSINPLFKQKSHVESGLIFNPGGFNSLSYQASNKVRLGMWIWGRAKIYGKSTTADDDRFSYFFAPKIDYTFSDNHGLTAFYQVNGAAVNDYKIENGDDDSLNLLYSYTVNKFLTIEPMITMYRESNFDPAKSNINVWMSGRIF